MLLDDARSHQGIWCAQVCAMAVVTGSTSAHEKDEGADAGLAGGREGGLAPGLNPQQLRGGSAACRRAVLADC